MGTELLQEMISVSEKKGRIRAINADAVDRLQIFCLFCDVANVNVFEFARNECMEAVSV